MVLRRLFLLLAIGWMLVIFYLSHQPTLGIPQPFSHSDKLYHAVTFGLLAALWLLSMKPGEAGFSRQQALAAAAIASLYGMSDEIHQHFIDGRQADWLDWLADSTGALLAALLIARLSRWPGAYGFLSR